MKDSNTRKPAGYQTSIHLIALTIALCLALTVLAVTTSNVYASPSVHSSTKSMDRLARGGGGGGHGGSSGGHAGASDTGEHSISSDTTTLHNSTEEENNTTNNAKNTYNGRRNFIPASPSSNQNNISITQALWSLLIMVVVLAFLFYLSRRRAQKRL